MSNYSFTNKDIRTQSSIIAECKHNKALLDKVIQHNENLIWHTIYKYLGGVDLITGKYRVEKDDLYQLGCIGFIKAVKAFDPNRGNRFSTFAIPSIYREIKCFLRDQGNMIKPTRSASELTYKITKLRREHPYGEYLSNSEIARLLQAAESEVDRALALINNTAYTEELFPVNEYGTENIKDDYNLEEEAIAEMEAKALIDKLLEKMDDTEKLVLKMRLKGNLSQAQTAKTIGITEMKVSRILKKIRNLTDKAIYTGPEKAAKTTRNRPSKYDDYICIIKPALSLNPCSTTQELHDAIRSANPGLAPLPPSMLYYIKRITLRQLRKEKNIG